MAKNTYAIISSGNKQYRVSEGDIIDVDLMSLEKNQSVKFDKVLLVNKQGGIQVGNPHVTKAVVQGEVLGHLRAPKVIAYKYKKRKNYRRKIGHRQNYTRIKVTEITA